MEDVAKPLGVAQGTPYVYVESKEALSDLVARCADREEVFAEVPRLPVRTPKRGATIAYVQKRLAENQTLPTLSTALTRTRGGAPRGEFRQIVRELYDAVERNRYGLKLLDRTARDQPELGALWFEGARDGLLAALTEYLKREMRRGTMKEMPDVSVAARFIIETAVFWGVYRYLDPHPQIVDDAAARETAIQLIINAFTGSEHSSLANFDSNFAGLRAAAEFCWSQGCCSAASRASPLQRVPLASGMPREAQQRRR